jgi:hypothetical protein
MSRYRSKWKDLLLPALAVALAWPVPAEASPTFPGELQDQLDIPCVPQCTLCHRDTNGGSGTVVEPFGQSMFDAGLRASRPERIATALDLLEFNSVDSDGDGVTDVEELSEGRNPNQSGAGLLCATYGCSAGRAPDRTVDAVGLVFVLSLIAFRTAQARRCREKRVQ